MKFCIVNHWKQFSQFCLKWQKSLFDPFVKPGVSLFYNQRKLWCKISAHFDLSPNPELSTPIESRNHKSSGGQESKCQVDVSQNHAKKLQHIGSVRDLRPQNT